MKKLLFTLFFVLLGISILGLSPYSLYADPATDVQNQINSTNAQIKALDQQISNLENQITTTSQQKKTLASLIKELALTKAKLVKEQQQTQVKISATNFAITALNTDINTKQTSINNSKQSLARMLNDLHKSDRESMIIRLLSQENFADASREYSNIISINENARKHINDVSSQQQALTVSKTTKVGEQTKLTTLKTTLIQTEAEINATAKEQNSILTETKNKEAIYQKLLTENQKKRDAFEKQLSDYESKLKFILNPNLLPTSGSGVLSWPLDKVFITQLFGVTSSSGRLYRAGSHSGVDFRASIGTPVKSMGNGVVLGTGNTDLYCKGTSFGKWVFIKYDNGLSSTFGHLSVISSSAGQLVKTGDVVALSGSTGHSTGPHLHVTVYASQGARVDTVPSLSCSGHTFIMPIAPTSAYLDPMLYFPTISSKLIKNAMVKD
jgi:murein DD-endopeptidase MepM/ murein hydrolase activator NlpD